MTVYITHHEINDEGMPVPGGGADAVVHNRKADGSFAEYPIRSGGRTGSDMTRSQYEQLRAARERERREREERERKEKARKEKEEKERKERERLAQEYDYGHGIPYCSAWDSIP